MKPGSRISARLLARNDQDKRTELKPGPDNVTKLRRKLRGNPEVAQASLSPPPRPASTSEKPIEPISDTTAGQVVNGTTLSVERGAQSSGDSQCAGQHQ